MTKRISILVLSLLFLPLTVAAQNNELGVFISTSQLEDNEIQDAGDVFDVEFEEEMGVGVLYNRFWFGGFSTEIAYQRLGADLTLSFGDVTENVANLDLDVLSATGQLHFARGSIISPYVGGGAAYISGEAGSIDQDEADSVDLENELDFLVNAGLNVSLGRSFGVFLDGKYILYEALGEGDPEDEALELNPLIISAGLKFKF